ncbi:MAG TPA: hypothetical protein ENG84_07895 [Gammaproteobacteria bacterium]|nr:hypothetical protein [Gammaproteobacteria bacterium]
MQQGFPGYFAPQSRLDLLPEFRDECCRSPLYGLEFIPGGVAEVIEIVSAEIGQAVLLETGRRYFIGLSPEA